jgi:hypothetical protein
MTRKDVLGCALLAIAMCGCTAHKRVAPQYGLAPDRSYIDIEPGWRLRIVTPLLKSGGYRVRTAAETRTSGLNIELRVDSDFLGYELAYYAFEPKGRIRLTSVEATVNGATEPRTQPTANLFTWPKDARFLRLVFLTRASAADHDMAVLTARRLEDLDTWTAKLRDEPETACKETPYCSWIPGGIAVTAERRDSQSNNWVPADRAGRPTQR